MIRKFAVMFICFIITLSSPVLASVEGQGRFNSVSEDSLSFVRNQLLYRAFRDVLNKELVEMGLDANAFWKRYEERFEESFKSVEESLREKFSDENGNISADQREEFQMTLRRRRLAALSRFGNLPRAIQSYSIRGMSRSAQAAQSRFLNLDAKVNRRMLNSIYSEFMQEGQPRYFSQLYFSPNFRLKEGGWSDLGVEKESDFTDVVKKHWLSWIKTKLNRSVQEMVVTDETQVELIKDFLKKPREDAQTLIANSQQKDGLDADFVEGKEVETQQLESSLSNSLWLEIQIEIAKTSEDDLLNQRSFEYSGSVLLMDLRTRDILLAKDISTEEHTYQTVDQQELSSNIASFVYRMPMGGLEKVPSRLAQVDSRDQSLMIRISNLSSISDLYRFNELLAQEGLTENFDPKVISFNGLQARVQLNFKGDGVKALGRLRNLHLRSLNETTTAVAESVERPFEFSLEHRINPPMNRGEEESSSTL